jgi:gamma-glutamylcyclotransferase (GGCT)/AIG2-like uncharacterized protein YtfP
MKKHKVLVYGTLRPFTNTTETSVKGRLYDLGSYPGIILDERGDDVVCEVIEVSDAELAILDSYEGYDESNPRYSLYIRRELDNGSFIYEYNRPYNEQSRIREADWMRYKTGWVTSRLPHVLGKEFAGVH